VRAARAILYFFSACFALLTLVGSPSDVKTPFLDHLVVAASVVAASLLLGAALISRSPIERLTELRRTGAFLRNSLVTSPTEFELWSERFWFWRKEIIHVARETPGRLADRLEVLKEMYVFPAGIIPFSSEHARLLGILSEILRQVDRHIEAHA
jgi:hypothetical protein